MIVALFFLAVLSLALAVTLAIEVSQRPGMDIQLVECILQPSGSEFNISGILQLYPYPSGTHIVGTVIGLKPYQEHGVHIHEYGAVAKDASDAGLHYNPDKKPHGCLETGDRHAGDLVRFHIVLVQLLSVVFFATIYMCIYMFICGCGCGCSCYSIGVHLTRKKKMLSSTFPFLSLRETS